MSLPQPYYQDEACTIYHGDCREILPLLPVVDLVLTDPPYGIFKTKDSGIMFGKQTIYFQDSSASTWDVAPNPETLLLVTSKADNWILWGGNYFADTLGSCKGIYIWDKMTGDNGYADAECAWNNYEATTRIFKHQWCGAFKDSERGLRAVHPTQKPIQLMTWCIYRCDKKQYVNTILDPFMGSGTTLRAAKDLGRRAIGIELSEAYCEIAANRLRQEVLL